MKRVLDIIASAVGLIVLTPLLLPVIAILRLTGEGEVFYRQQRVGRSGRIFSLLKFATMLKNSPGLAGGDVTGRNDPRVLPFGRFLRDSKINELPQLWNILVGDMSIIGPRPLTPRVAALFPPEHWQAIANLKPGLSGIGSIVFRNEEAIIPEDGDRQAFYRDVIAPRKAELELWYARNQSFSLDIKLILLTVLVVLKPATDINRLLPGLPPAPKALVG